MRFNYLSLSVKSKRSQSALEYMMTYGWAILIIVIVAVIFVISIGYPTEFCTDNDKPPLSVKIAEDTGVLEKPVIVVDM